MGDAGASAHAGSAGAESRARLAGPRAAQALITTEYSDAQGGKCASARTPTRPGQALHDHLLCPINAIRTSWDVYQCNFADLVQQRFGLEQAALDPASVYSVQFTQSRKLLPVDLWLVDVSLVLK